MGDAIAIWGFKLEDDLAGRGAAQAFEVQGRVGGVAKQRFEGLPLLGTTASVVTLA